jgi:hypothetical protein
MGKKEKEDRKPENGIGTFPRLLTKSFFSDFD